MSLIAAACSSDDDEPDTTEPAVPSETTTESTEPEGLAGEGLDIGVLAPPSGLLSTLFEGQDRGIANAVADIDDAGGVLGGPAVATTFETPLDATEADVVPDAFADGADVLIGPAGSNAAVDVRNVLDEDGGIACSASASVPGITSGQEQFGLFRTALPDDILVAYLANEIAAVRDEVAPGAAARVTIVARSDAYGLAVGNGLAASLEVRGLVPTVVDYNPRRVTFTPTAEEVAATNPDLTVLVTYAEGVNLVTALVRAGLPADRMIGLDAFFAPRVAERAAPDGDVSLVDGFRMVGTIGNRAFLQRLFDEDPNGEISYAAQAYDCAVVLALATESVAADASESMTEAVIDVTGGGVPCSTYADCLDGIAAGEDIDYDGVSGLLAIDDEGDPTFGRFTTAIIADGEVTEENTTDVDVALLEQEAEIFAAASLNTRLQQALTFLGFYSGPINGLDTPEFRAAMAAFQTSVGLPPTGVLDAATYTALVNALGEYAALLTQSVIDIQILLTDLGFYDGPIDGVWSEELTASIKALQRELGVPETGVLDAATLQAIYDRGVQDGSTTTTAPPTTAPPTTAPGTTAPPTTVAPTTPPTPPPTTAPPTTAPVPPTTLPPPNPDLDNLFDTLAADPDFSIVVGLLQSIGIDDEFEQLRVFTFFAPTNAAFDGIPAADLEALKNDPGRLSALLGYHLAEGRLLVADLPPTLVTENGATMTITRSGSTVSADGAPITRPDILASNGVIQGLGTLLDIPEER